MARINWRVVFKICKAHGWREVDLCRMLGISQSHFSDLKHGRRKVSMAFADMLIHVLRISYNDLLIHPTYEIQPSARVALALTDLDDGRPWPVREAAEAPDHRTRYQRWECEQRNVQQISLDKPSGLRIHS